MLQIGSIYHFTAILQDYDGSYKGTVKVYAPGYTEALVILSKHPEISPDSDIQFTGVTE